MRNFMCGLWRPLWTEYCLISLVNFFPVVFEQSSLTVNLTLTLQQRFRTEIP